MVHYAKRDHIVNKVKYFLDNAIIATIEFHRQDPNEISDKTEQSSKRLRKIMKTTLNKKESILAFFEVPWQ